MEDQAPAAVSAGRRRARLVGQAMGIVRPVFVDRIDRDHTQTDRAFRYRRVVVVITLLVGAGVLGMSFSTEPGDPAFYPLTLALAATWAVGSLVSGPLHLGHVRFRDIRRRPIVVPILVGLLLAAIFVLGGLVFREIPALAGFTQDVLGYARYGSLPVLAGITVVNGIAEELFFRGALFAAIGVRYPVVISTLCYAAATVAGGNPVLVLAAAVLGAVVGLQRRASGGVLAPVLTHITWSMAMLLVLPPLFGAPV